MNKPYEYKHSTSELIKDVDTVYTVNESLLRSDMKSAVHWSHFKVSIGGLEYVGYILSKLDLERDEDGNAKKFHFSTDDEDIDLKLTIDVDKACSSNVRLWFGPHSTILLSNYIDRHLGHREFTDAIEKGDVIKFKLEFNDSIAAPVFESIGFVVDVKPNMIVMRYRTDERDLSLVKTFYVESIKEFHWTNVEEDVEE